MENSYTAASTSPPSGIGLVSCIYYLHMINSSCASTAGSTAMSLFALNWCPGAKEARLEVRQQTKYRSSI